MLLSQFITAMVSGCLGSVMVANWSGKLRFRSKLLLLLRPLYPLSSPVRGVEECCESAPKIRSLFNNMLVP